MRELLYLLIIISLIAYEDPLVSRFRNPIVKSSAQLESARNKPPSEIEQPESAPNISLNIHGGSKNEELYVAALGGIVLQFGMLMFCGCSVYHLEFSQRFPKNGHPVEAYAFPIMALGTILLMVRMLVCSAVVDKSTEETEYLRQPDKSTEETEYLRQPESPNACVLWLQKSHAQAFDSFALFQSSILRGRILTSRRQGNKQTTPSADPFDAANKLVKWAERRVKRCVKMIASDRIEALTLLGVFFGESGFILQFQVGLEVLDEGIA
jgi:hypothetical protein